MFSSLQQVESAMEAESVQCAMARTASRVPFSPQNIQCIVSLKDDTCYCFNFKEDAKGQDVMDKVCERLGIVEKDYFGLQYTNSRGEIHWLNTRNRISKQFTKLDRPQSLLFCVKFYVPPHQLLQDSSRHQFFLNIRYDLLNGTYDVTDDIAAILFALIGQAEAGIFRENHISYNPSRTAGWTPDFRSQVILEHCKLKDMNQEVAIYFCLKQFSELDDYGMKLHEVRIDDNNKLVTFGIGIDCLKIERENGFERIPYSCLRMATHSGKTVKIDIYTTELGDIDNIVYRLNSKEAACALYRSITEHHAFYRCDSIRPAVKEQVARDFIDTVLSFFHDDKSSEQNYIFDTERTCREAYDHARRILYNFGASTAAAMSSKDSENDSEKPLQENDKNYTEHKVAALQEELNTLKDSFYCPVCRDTIVDNVLDCGHFICETCSSYCEVCPLCRCDFSSKRKCYLPVTITTIHAKVTPTSDDECELSNAE